MLVRLLEARGFRNLREAVIEPGEHVTLIHGPNGAGKTNLLEALAFGLTGFSWRTRADRELIGLRYGSGLDTAEVAQILGISEGSVRTRLWRVLRRLRGAMAR